MADSDTVQLRYVGNGNFFVGIPTTDLPSDSYTPTAEEVEMLVASGLYERVTPAPVEPAQPKRSRAATEPPAEETAP